MNNFSRGVAAGFVCLLLLGAGLSQMPLQTQNAGTPLGAATTINCSGSSTCTLAGGVLSISSPSSSSGGGGGGYATIQDEAGALTQRTVVNFTGAGVACVDNAGSTRTDCTIASAGIAPAGSASSVQFNAGGGSLGAAANVLVTGGNLQLSDTTLPSSTPSSGLVIYARSRANKRYLNTIGPAGLDTPLQPGLFANRIYLWTAPISGTTPSVTGWIAWTAITGGTVANNAPASTNLLLSVPSITYPTTATANSVAGTRVATAHVWRGNAVGLGGFFLAYRFGLAGTLTAPKLFVGLGNAAAPPSMATGVEPTSATNTIFFGAASTNANLNACINGATGSATCTDLGASFPVRTANAFYEARIFAAPSSTAIYYNVQRLDVAAEVDGAFSFAGTVPSSTTFMAPVFEIGNGATAAAASIMMNRIYLESDY
jgi:hypothetical protein